MREFMLTRFGGPSSVKLRKVARLSRRSTPRQGGATFSMGHRVFRAVWLIVWSVLGVWTPRPFFGWRRFLAGAFGARLAPTARIYPGVRIWYPPNLVMGEHACMADEVNCYCMAPIRLDDFALVSQGAFLCAGSHNIDVAGFPLVTASIHIGRSAWVAAQAFVGPGVAMGEGSVLGARGVAFRSLEPGGVYAGNPAHFLRWRKNVLRAKGV